jgi:hypothetical protein
MIENPVNNSSDHKRKHESREPKVNPARVVFTHYHFLRFHAWHCVIVGRAFQRHTRAMLAEDSSSGRGPGYADH